MKKEWFVSVKFHFKRKISFEWYQLIMKKWVDKGCLLQFLIMTGKMIGKNHYFITNIYLFICYLMGYIIYDRFMCNNLYKCSRWPILWLFKYILGKFLRVSYCLIIMIKTFLSTYYLIFCGFFKYIFFELIAIFGNSTNFI